jgi:hypothetical protein
MRYRFAIVATIPLLALTALQTPPRLRGTADLTIGGEDADPPYSFGKISSLALGADGRIYVADSQDEQIRVYSDAGKFLFAIGRKGGGPGEFAGLASIAFSPDGSLWVRDEGNGRYQSFTIAERDARYKGTLRMLHPSFDFHAPLVFDASGKLIEIGRVNEPNASPYRIVRTTLGPDSRVVRADTIKEPPADSLGVHLIRFERTNDQKEKVWVTRYFYEPFPALPVVAHGPNGEIARGVSSRYSVLWSSLQGQRLHFLQREMVPPEPTASERASAQKNLDSQREWAKTVQASLPDFRFPSRKPILTQMQFSNDGELWIERSAASGQPHEADMYDRRGQLVAIAEWTGQSMPTFLRAIRGRTMITVATDSNEVERVVRMRFK